MAVSFKKVKVNKEAIKAKANMFSSKPKGSSRSIEPSYRQMVVCGNPTSEIYIHTYIQMKGCYVISNCGYRVVVLCFLIAALLIFYYLGITLLLLFSLE